MSYDKFIKEVLAHFSEKYKGLATVRIERVRKNNGVVYDGLVIVEEGRNITPTLYLNMFYENLSEEDSIEELFAEIEEMYLRNVVEEDFDISFFKDYRTVKESLSVKLVNFEKNAAYLEECPHVRILDLALVFYYYFPDFRNERGSIVVKNEHLKYWNVTKEELLEDAKANAKKMFPPNIMPFTELISEHFAEEVFPLPMFIATNKGGLFGASVIVYSDCLEKFAEIVESDVYLIPCSIHEMILLPVDESIRPANMNDIVKEVNEISLCEEDVLSDHIYLYKRETKELISA